jgi:hypothetical protein
MAIVELMAAYRTQAKIPLPLCKSIVRRVFPALAPAHVDVIYNLAFYESIDSFNQVRTGLVGVSRVVLWIEGVVLWIFLLYRSHPLIGLLVCLPRSSNG